MKVLIGLVVVFAICLSVAILFISLLRKELKNSEIEIEKYKRNILTLKGDLERKEIEAQVKKEVEKNVKKETQKLHKGSSSDRFNAASNILRND